METENLVKYSCCFCKGTVSSKIKSHPLDPCALIVIGHIDKNYEDRKEQEFYCHIECFRRLINDDSLHIAESDFATIGEIASESDSDD